MCRKKIVCDILNDSDLKSLSSGDRATNKAFRRLSASFFVDLECLHLDFKCGFDRGFIALKL
jgi:hypothetical protein